MKIIVTGVRGMLGQDILKTFVAAGHDVIGADRDALDITNRNAVLAYVRAAKPDAIINTAAYNFVDKVEDPEVYPVAYAVNATGPRNLAEAAKELDIPFVHYSTDYVFAGDRRNGYAENDLTSPISKYGETKAEGERLIQQFAGKFYIVRTSKLFGQPGIGEGTKMSFVALMLKLAAEKPELMIVDEEVGCPTYTPDLADATLRLFAENATPGIYHFVNAGPPVTWYAFAEEVFALKSVTTPRKPVPSSQFPRAAKAPKFAALRNSSAIQLPDRASALARFLA